MRLCRSAFQFHNKFHTINVQINIDFVILYKEKENSVGASIARPQGLDDFSHRATNGRPYKIQYICAFFRIAHL